MCIFTIPALAAKVKNPKCKDFVEVQDKYQPEYLAVVDGYNKAGKEVDQVVDMDVLVTQARQVKDECNKNKSEPLARARKNTNQAIRAKDSSMPATEAARTAATPTRTAMSSLNPRQAKCQDFLVLGEQYQPVAAYWVVGNSKTGSAKNGNVEEEFLERPVATLVQDCQANPTASFYDRAKNWVSKKI
jgi:hypothetical protein